MSKSIGLGLIQPNIYITSNNQNEVINLFLIQ